MKIKATALLLALAMLVLIGHDTASSLPAYQPVESGQPVSFLSTNVTNSLAETVLMSANISANALLAGSILRVRAHGLLTDNASATSGTWRVRIGQNTLTGNVTASENATLGVSLAKQPWKADFTIRVKSTGLAGTAIGEGMVLGSLGTSAAAFIGGSAQTADVVIPTTLATVCELTFTWGGLSTNNTCWIYVGSIEIVKF